MAPRPDAFGSFSIWIFKLGVDPQDSSIGGVHVGPIGVAIWGHWQAVNPVLHPGSGYRAVLERHSNVVLYYRVFMKKASPPVLPDGFRQLDATLADI